MSEPSKRPIAVAVLGPGTVGLPSGATARGARRGPRRARGRAARTRGRVRARCLRCSARASTAALLTGRRRCTGRVARTSWSSSWAASSPPGRSSSRRSRREPAVVTANKALLAAHGPELFEAADAASVDLYFEAAVAGAIPIMRPVRESLAGDHVRRILGIVNGTTNYVLDEMTHARTRLRRRRQAGPRPWLRGGGPDGRRRGLRRRGQGRDSREPRVPPARFLGRRLPRGHLAPSRRPTSPRLRESGHVIKLLAIAETGRRRRSPCAFTPPWFRLAHPLAGVHGAYNAVFVEAEAAGELMFYGQGAGGLPTASAVLGDVVSRCPPPRVRRARAARIELRRQRRAAHRCRVYPLCQCA